MLRGVVVEGGWGLVAEVQVRKATGVVYLPRLGFMCSPGIWALGTQPPLATYVVNTSLLGCQRIHYLIRKY